MHVISLHIHVYMNRKLYDRVERMAEREGGSEIGQGHSENKVSVLSLLHDHVSLSQLMALIASPQTPDHAAMNCRNK